MSKFKRIILTELGETGDTYDWRLTFEDESQKMYEFYSDENKYELFVESFKADFLVVGFGLKNGTFGKKFSAVTNEGNQFKVASTAIEIAEHAWKTRDSLKHGDTVKGFSISAPRESDGGPNVRIEFYKKFIKNRFPGAKIRVKGDEMLVIVNE